MLGAHTAVATVAVKDLKAAKDFYETKLGLTVDRTEGDEAITCRNGDAKLLVYRSQFAGTNRATGVNWVVDDVAQTAKDLAAKGVRFEHYDLPGLERDGDLHRAGGFVTAWFKDPDGNIHSLIPKD